MILGFKRRFAQYIREGSKTHTIRDDVNDRWKVGVLVDAFVDPRQKTMERLMPQTPCVRTERIEIIPENGAAHWPNIKVYVDGVLLSPDEREALAYRDGFRTQGIESHFAEMMEFWEGRLPFKGKIIHWVFPG